MDTMPCGRVGPAQYPGELHRPGFYPYRSESRDVAAGEAAENWLKASQPSPRIGTPEDVSPLAVYLASCQSDYVTGQIITVDGGHTVTAMWPFIPASESV